jgi:D-glycero-D-manno-heptose 1,7-bisphosphate phosphatase
MAERKAIFLDRDGTLIRDVHYLKDPEKVEIILGIAEALDSVRQLGYLLFMHTNQSGIARGYYQWSDVHACNKKMFQEFGWSKDFFTEICIAPEDPTAAEGYRKPSPKFEFEMIEKFDLNPQQCWVVGDKWIDPQTGLNASMRGALVKTGKPITAEWQKQAESEKVPIYKDVAEFAEKEVLLNV